MSKLKKNFTREVIYAINDSVQFDWIGQKHMGVIERINTEGREYPVYHIRSTITNRVYNMGADPGVTTAGYIIEKVSGGKKIVKKPTTAPTTATVTQETSTESVELQKAIQKQKDFINHFFEV
jgi:hypothetical protein